MPDFHPPDPVASVVLRCQLNCNSLSRTYQVATVAVHPVGYIGTVATGNKCAAPVVHAGATFPTIGQRAYRSKQERFCLPAAVLAHATTVALSCVQKCMVPILYFVDQPRTARKTTGRPALHA